MKLSRIVLLASGILLAGGLFLFGYNLHAPEITTPIKQIPSDSKAIVTILPDKVLINDGSTLKEVKIPKSGKSTIDMKKSGEVLVEGPGWMPILCTVPNVGINFGKKVEPYVGVQLIREEPLGLGLGPNLSPSMVGISLDKDLGNSVVLGIQYGYTFEGDSRVSFKVGVTF